MSDGFERLKVYEHDQDTGKDYKAYSMPSNVHVKIRDWQADHQFSSLTDTIQDIVNTAYESENLQGEINRLKSQLEIYEGKANLSGIALDKPLQTSLTEQVNQEVEKQRTQDELRKIKEKLAKTESSLAGTKSKYKKLKKNYKVALSELEGNKLNLNGIFSDIIQNPQHVGTLLQAFNGRSQLNGLPEANHEAKEFMTWFMELFPDENDQNDVSELLELLSSNPKNIKVVIDLLKSNIK